MAEVEQSQRDGPVTEYVRREWRSGAGYGWGWVLVLFVPVVCCQGADGHWSAVWHWLAVGLLVSAICSGVGRFCAWRALPSRLEAARRLEQAFMGLQNAYAQCPVCDAATLAWDSGPGMPWKRIFRVACPECGVRWSVQLGEDPLRLTAIALADPGFGMSGELAETLPRTTSPDEWLAWFSRPRT